MLIAGAIIPLIAMIGGGFDMGRMYASKTRLQHACDAAVLAGRKAMVGTTFSAANKSTAERFFKFNFPTGKYGTRFPDQEVDGAIPGLVLQLDDGQLAGQAEALVPMTLMAIFGADERPIKADCRAELNLPNSDIMFVLDTTGSMNSTNPGDSASRIQTLRGAVSTFYNAIAAANAAGAQIRYGFVPYSKNVNVGYLLEADWMVNNWTYQSRVADGVDTVTTAATTGTSSFDDSWQPISGSWTDLAPVDLTPSTCTQPDDTVQWGGEIISTSTEPYAGPPAGTKTIEVRTWSADGIDYWIDKVSNWVEGTEVISSCRLLGRRYDSYVEQFNRNIVPTETAETTGNVFFWSYQPVQYDVSALKGLTSGGSITAQIGDNHTMRTVNWSGCIEERRTVRGSDFSPIPGAAFDMDIDRIPNPANPATQWAPHLPGLVFARRHHWDPNQWVVDPVRSGDNYFNFEGSEWAACPSPARRLGTITSAALNTYLDSLVAVGSTHHDIGLIWGARLLSPDGLFATENRTAPNGNTIARHLIFMTDGETDTQPYAYDAYGYTALDRRRVEDPNETPTKEEIDEIVAARTSAMCEAIKGKGITIWVIAFGTDLNSMLTNCASDGRAFQANNSAQLTTAFDEIAAGISQLRLTR